MKRTSIFCSREETASSLQYVATQHYPRKRVRELDKGPYDPTHSPPPPPYSAHIALATITFRLF